MREPKKIRDSAMGQDCTVRLPYVCNHNPDTTVFAHLSGVRFGHGMGKKTAIGAYCCSDCHDVIDGRRSASTEDGVHRKNIKIAFYEGILETQIKLMEQGLLKYA